MLKKLRSALLCATPLLIAVAIVVVAYETGIVDLLWWIRKR
jgi:hypothetical protein